MQGSYRGEDHCQDYAMHNPQQPYILNCDVPEIAALKIEYPDLFVAYKGK